MQFGQCVACGDVNGDEYDDILITASLMNYPYYSGIAYLFYGGAEMDTIPDWSYTEDEMIPVCSIAPKLNGDNFADVLLYTYSSTLVFFGSESLSNTPNQIFNAKGGYIGDLNNDGYDDLLGTGHIIWGSDSGLSTVTYFNVGFPIWGSVGSSSDFNGDSFLEFGYYSINPQQIGGYRGTIYLYADSILSGINRKPVLSLSDFSLQQNYPNPFNNSTIISFNLNITENVEIYIYNILGQKVVELMNEQTVAGFHQISWNAEGLSSGVYLIRLETPEGFSQSRKAIIVK
jgi:hypothetical protein